MKIFADFHHSGLYASLIHLFETRLGHELYRPIGKDWFNKGYWKIAEPYNNDAGTVAQYLEIGYQPDDGTQPLNENRGNGIYHKGEEVTHKVITFEDFKETKFDVLIASIPQHIPVYKELIEIYQPDAKLIYQMGNVGWSDEIPWGRVDNIMASVKEFPVPPDKRAVFYRQEFKTNYFQPQKEHEEAMVSFIHPMYKTLYAADLANELGVKLRDYGYSLNNVKSIGKAMQNARFAYHNKPGGDGYGHIIHNWGSVGKPLFVNLRDYKDKLAGEFLIDGVTCIDISERTPKEAAKAMLESNQETMSRRLINKFNQVVDFDKDAKKVQEFLDDLL